MSNFKVGQSIPVHKKIDTQSADQKKIFEQKMKGAAQLYEKMFMREMVKAMRSTITHSELTQPTMAEKIYQDKIDDKYVDNWSNRGGVGLADIIYQQLNERFSPYKGVRMLKPQGPVPINKEGMQKIKKDMPLKIKNNLKNQIGFIFDLSDKNLSKNSLVKSPWSGTLTQVLKMSPYENQIQIKHDNGLLSNISFMGQLEHLEKGQKVDQGESIGKNFPHAERLNWTVIANV